MEKSFLGRIVWKKIPRHHKPHTNFARSIEQPYSYEYHLKASFSMPTTEATGQCFGDRRHLEPPTQCNGTRTRPILGRHPKIMFFSQTTNTYRIASASGPIYMKPISFSSTNQPTIANGIFRGNGSEPLRRCVQPRGMATKAKALPMSSTNWNWWRTWVHVTRNHGFVLNFSANR